MATECFHPGEYLQDEMDARGLDIEDVAAGMGPDCEYGVNYLTLEFILTLRDERAIIGRETFTKIAKALGQDDVEAWVALEDEWKRCMALRRN